MLSTKPFCWTRFGTEAGELIDDIFARKEEERVLNDGVFLWGIGNGLKPSMLTLVSEIPRPEIVFSPILSRARDIDVNPDRVVAWMRAITMDNKHYNLPKGTFVTSRQSCRAHFALVCKSERPLKPATDGPQFSISSLRNLVSGRPVGASQVTSIVQFCDDRAEGEGKSYTVALRATLVPPYLVRLVNPCPLPDEWHREDVVDLRKRVLTESGETPLPLFA